MTYTSTKAVSAVHTPADPTLAKLGMVPLGACVWTSSGDLAERGITAIAHAAPGSMTKPGQVGFDPTRESVAASLENAFLLATTHGHSRLGVTFIAGGIFFRRIKPSIDRDGLARVIVGACQAHRGGVEAVIVCYDAGSTAEFKRAMADNDDPGVTMVSGSITNHADHGCAAIVNAANMEVEFGGGLSEAIGDATGHDDEINAEAAAAIAAFWKVNGGAT